MKKSVKKEIKYTKSEVLKAFLKGLGYSEEHIKDIIKCAESEPSSRVTSKVLPKETKTKETRFSKQRNEAFDKIISILSSNPYDTFTVEELSEEIGVPLTVTRGYMNQLKENRKIKVVAYEMIKPGPATLLYQTYRNPMKALKIVSPEDGYDSVNGYAKKCKQLFGKFISQPVFAEAVEKEKLSETPMLTGVGVVKGYKISELKRVALGLCSTSEVKTKKKCAKKTKKVTSKTKHKYTKKVQLEPEVQVSLPQTKGLSFLEKLFKKEQTSADLIKF